VLYGKNVEKAHIDIIGAGISLSSKIASVARPNQVLVGEHVYEIVISSPNRDNLFDKSKFVQISLDPLKWKYLSQSDPESLYHVYEYLVTG
jgi:class 3 adenylate cyclase